MFNIQDPNYAKKSKKRNGGFVSIRGQGAVLREKTR